MSSANSRPQTALNKRPPPPKEPQEERPSWDNRFISTPSNKNSNNSNNSNNKNKDNYQNNHNNSNKITKSDLELMQANQIIDLKLQLKRNQENAINAAGIIHRLEAELTRSMKDNMSLLSSHEFPPKVLRTIKKEVSKKIKQIIIKHSISISRTLTHPTT
tara:strand:+ start:137 stop:616 length:480 start_codon:yes stop_codon:yes gene_type:complete